jgi:hypothetical protein
MRLFYPIDRDRPVANWSAIVRSVQDDRHYMIDGKPLPRIPFGSDSSPAGVRSPFCRGCAADRGQLHVPGCSHEVCPCCGDSFVSCDCTVDDLEDGFAEVQE